MKTGMKIRSLAFWLVRLPFRFSFKHNLAARDYSRNLIAQATVEDESGEVFEGWGEGVPRDYVTGETAEQALNCLASVCAPRFMGKEFATADQMIQLLTNEFYQLGFNTAGGGAAWCALELSLLDCVSKAYSLNAGTWLAFAGNKNETKQTLCSPPNIVYGGVIPFSTSRALQAVLWFYRFYGFKTVKLKVGGDFVEDVERIKLARSILGDNVTIRVDANAAWSADQAIQFAESARKFKVASIEQPVAAHDLASLAKVTSSIPEEVVADETLCTISQAKTLADEKICTGFNIRLSKVGGFLAAAEIASIARGAGINCHLGAQVGESGILSAAGRSFAYAHGPFANCEGSANFFLLKQDLTKENLTMGPGGVGKVLSKPGFGITVRPDRLYSLQEDSGKSGVAHRATPDVMVRC
jgi:muconate cycloisomerase